MTDSIALTHSRRSPAKGVFVDQTDKDIRITGKLEIYGPEATAARAVTIQNTINSLWTGTFTDGARITCNVTVTYRAPGTRKGHAGQIEVRMMKGASNYSPVFKEINLDAGDSNAFTWVVAHEFGHMIGLDDRYNEKLASKIKGSFGGTRTTTIQPGYENNMMGTDNGKLEKQNVLDLIRENKPSWVKRDDRVRDWVHARKTAEIRHVSTSNKIAMIGVLTKGWISRRDLMAVIKIIESVEAAAEAAKIRAAVKQSDFGFLFQWRKVKAALDGMPK